MNPNIDKTKRYIQIYIYIYIQGKIMMPWHINASLMDLRIKIHTIQKMEFNQLSFHITIVYGIC